MGGWSVNTTYLTDVLSKLQQTHHIIKKTTCHYFFSSQKWRTFTATKISSNTTMICSFSISLERSQNFVYVFECLSLLSHFSVCDNSCYTRTGEIGVLYRPRNDPQTGPEIIPWISFRGWGSFRGLYSTTPSLFDSFNKKMRAQRNRLESRPEFFYLDPLTFYSLKKPGKDI